MWYKHKDRHIDQGTQNSPEFYWRIDSQLIFDKGDKNSQWGKDSLQ